MFTLDYAVDAIQTGKKTFVNTFVTNETMKAEMLKFIDAQADYTKKALKATTDATAAIASEGAKAMQDVAKFDLTKFYDTVSQSFKAKK